MSSERLERKKKATEQKLVNAATRLFAERGIYQSSIDEITSAADLGKGTFYKHFDTRDQLLAAVIRQGLDLLIKELGDGIKDQALTSRDVLENHIRFFREHPEYLLIFHQARGWLELFKPDDGPVRKELRRYVDSIEDILRREIPENLVSGDHLEKKARFIAGAIAGVLSFELTVGDGLPLDSDLKNLFAVLTSPLFPKRREGHSWYGHVPLETIEEPESGRKPMFRPVGLHEWSSLQFLEEAEDWIEILRRDAGLETTRQSLLQRINLLHFNTYALDRGMHELDQIIVRDCARVWRGLLHPRSERLSGFSVLEALVNGACGREQGDLAPAFWAEICHLVRGVEGWVRLHEADFLKVSPDLHGREAAIVRSQELDRLEAATLDWMGHYADGLHEESVFRRAERRSSVLAVLGGEEEDWQDWRWQIGRIARTAEDLAGMAALSEDERMRIEQAAANGIPFGVTPYYASLFDEAAEAGRDRAVRAQVIPPSSYIAAFCPGTEAGGAVDFMQEADTSPSDLITRRYASIAILKPYNSCPQICVYCQRNWEIKGPLAPGSLARKEQIANAIGWLSDHPAIREVLITGGDPLTLSNPRLKWILDGIADIPHIERIRIGSRTPVTMPMRFTPALCRLLQSYRIPGRRELCLVTHVQHPYEVTPDLVKAVNRLKKHGVSVYNQLVYTFYISRRFEAAYLRRLLSRCGIDPYYTFYPKGKDETVDYRVPIARLLQERKEEARLLPGMARTDEIVYNVPGLGKNYLNAWQHRDLISIRPDGGRVYEFHPWEKKIAQQTTYVGDDVPILDYLKRLAGIGEKPEDYESIWYYF
jgi:lysine 2,3-aminomutase